MHLRLGVATSLVAFIQSTATTLSNADLTPQQKRQDEASAFGNLVVHSGVASLGPEAGAFIAGWDLGKSLYQNIPGFQHAADSGVTSAGQLLLGRQGFTQWSSRPSWIDNISRPQTLVGNIFSWF